MPDGRFAYPVLIGDIGGTNARLSLIETPGERHRPLARFATASYPTPEAAFAAELSHVDMRPRSAIIAVAGPVSGCQARLTNAGWEVDGVRLAAALGLENGLLVNDFEALAASLMALGEGDVATLVPGQPASDGVRLVLGPGTGFGAAAYIHRDGCCILLPTEAGHVGLGPEEAAEIKIWPALTDGLARVTVESLLSGEGLARLYRAVGGAEDMRQARVCAADVTTLALGGDPTALMAVVMFWRLLARVAGDLALTFKATGGVYIAGGIAPRLLPLTGHAALTAVFHAKPPMEELAARFALHVITASDATEQGLGAIAAAPAAFGLDQGSRLWRG